MAAVVCRNSRPLRFFRPAVRSVVVDREPRCQVVRGRSKKAPTIIVIEGRRLTLREAAVELGLRLTTLQKRIERGTRLTKPLQRHFYE